MQKKKTKKKLYNNRNIVEIGMKNIIKKAYQMRYKNIKINTKQFAIYK